MIASTSLPQLHVAMKEVSQADIRDLLSEVSLETSSSSDAASSQSSSSSSSAQEKKVKKSKKRFHRFRFRRHGKKGSSSNHKKSSLFSRVSCSAKAKPKQLFRKLQRYRSRDTLMLPDEECDCEMSGSLATGQIHSRISTGLATIPESTPLQEPFPQVVTWDRRKRLVKRFLSLLRGRARSKKSKRNTQDSTTKTERSVLSSRLLQRSRKMEASVDVTAVTDMHIQIPTGPWPLPRTVATRTEPSKARSMTTGSTSVVSFSALSGTMPDSKRVPTVTTRTTIMKPNKKKIFQYKRSKMAASSSEDAAILSDQKAIVKTAFKRLRRVDLSRFSAMALALYIVGAFLSQHPAHNRARFHLISKPAAKITSTSCKKGIIWV
jgi:hypothetical protein